MPETNKQKILVKASVANFCFPMMAKRRNHKMSLYPKKLRSSFPLTVIYGVLKS